MVLDHVRQCLITIALILVALMPVSCNKQEFTGKVKPGQNLDSKQGQGTLMLSEAKFPEGAERLVLTIAGAAPEITESTMIFPCTGYSGKEPIIEMGLKSPKRQPEEAPVPEDCSKLSPIDNTGRGVRHIELKRGDEVKPIRLLVGSYFVGAAFFDESSNLIYKGSADFDIDDGKQTTVKIVLKKVASGDVSIDFEVEQPSVLPSEITVDIVAIYEGSSRHDVTENVLVRVPDTSEVLSLSSYESVNWQIIGGANLKRIILSGYKRQTASHSTNATVTSYCYEGGCTESSYPSALSYSVFGNGCSGGWFYDVTCPQKLGLLKWLKTTALDVQDISIRSEQGAYTAPKGGFYLP